MTINGQTVAVSYKGNIAFDNTSETPSIWPQLKKNIDVKMNYAMGVYDGNLYDSNTGAMYLYLCTSKWTKHRDGVKWHEIRNTAFQQTVL